MHLEASKQKDLTVWRLHRMRCVCYLQTRMDNMHYYMQFTGSLIMQYIIYHQTTDFCAIATSTK